MQERRTKRGVVGWPYFLSGELYGGALRYDRRMDYHFSLFPPPPPPTLSPLSLYTPSLLRALSSCTSCKKARLLHALSTFSPPSPLQRHAKRNGQRVGGWLAVVVEKGPRRGARTTLHEDGKGWRGVGREIKAERSAKCSFFRAPFPPSDRCYQHARVFLRRGRMARRGKEREEKGKKERKGRRKADANPVKRG